MTIFIQIMIIATSLISCYLQFKPDNIDKIITRETMNWESKNYPNELIIDAKDILKIDYEIDDGSDVYFEIIPTEDVDLNETKTTTSPLTSVIIKEIPTKYHRC